MSRAAQLGPVYLEGHETCLDSLVEVAEQAGVLLPVRFGQEEEVRWRIRVLSADRWSLTESWGNSNLTVPQGTRVSAVEVAVMAAQSAAVSRELDRLFTLHACAVGKPGGAILICGPSFSGKSTVAHLLEEHHGFRLLSSNRSLISATGGSPKLVGGTLGITVRNGLGLLLRKLSKQLSTVESPLKLRRLRCDLAPCNSPSRIVAIFFLSVWPADVVACAINDADVRLMAALSEIPRMHVVIPTGSLLGQIWEEQATRVARYVIARQLASVVPCMHVSGRPPDVAELLARIYLRECG